MTLLRPCGDHRLPAQPRETQLLGVNCGNEQRFQPVWASNCDL